MQRRRPERPPARGACKISAKPLPSLVLRGTEPQQDSCPGASPIAIITTISFHRSGAMTSMEPFAVEGVSGVLHRADGAAERGAVLTHGAGGNHAAPLLVAVASTLCSAGFHVLRCDLPFRQRRPKGPPSSSSAAADREGLRLAVAAMRALGPRRVVLGGQSYGGRQATML